MQLKQIDLPRFTFEHKGVQFDVVGSYTGDGRYVLDVPMGWNALTVLLGQDSESLYEEMDEAVYNAMPELFERNYE